MKAEHHEEHMKQGLISIVLGILIIAASGGILLIPGAILFSFGLMRADLTGRRHV